MSKATYKFTATVFLYPGMAGWHFVSVPRVDSAKIKEIYGKQSKGWCSISVKVSVGKTSWKTSIFPDRKSGTYLLPLKAEIRKKADIYKDDKITFIITIQK